MKKSNVCIEPIIFAKFHVKESKRNFRIRNLGVVMRTLKNSGRILASRINKRVAYCDRCADFPFFALPSALCRIQAPFWLSAEASSSSPADSGTTLEPRAR